MRSRSDWMVDMIARLEPCAAALRADGTRAGPTIAACIEGVVARFRAELAAGSPPPPAAEEPVGWRSAVFNVGGRLDPFAGARWQRMLASAATCERLGAHDAARDFRKAAEMFRAEKESCTSVSPEIMQITSVVGIGRSGGRGGGGQRSIWTGANMPPPEPTPFTAGPQLGLFG